MVAAGCAALAILTLTGFALAASGGLFRQRPSSPVNGVGAHRDPQPAASARVGSTTSPGSGLAVSGTTLTSGAARDLARTWFQARDPARASNADRILKGLETADAYRVDQGFTAQILCGCEPPKHRHRLESVRVLVPAAPVRAFVAQFAATTIGKGQPIPVSYTVVFVVSSGTWRAAVVAFNDVGANAFHSRPGRATSSANTDHARTMLNRLGAYLQKARSTRRIPTLPSQAWTGTAPTIAKAYAKRGQDRPNSHGIFGRFSKPAATSAYAFPVVEGELVCGAIASTVVLTPSNGHLLLQDPARHNWGPTLTPGNYQSLTQYFVNEICMIVHPNGIRDVISFYGTTTGLKPTRTPAA
jgi:hypothetical protein